MSPEEMLNELESNQLEVVLIPAPDARHSGHQIRVAQSVNCDWYRKFCKQFLSSRRNQNSKGRTLIKRRETITALTKIIAAQSQSMNKGTISRIRYSIYVERILNFIEHESRPKQSQIDDWMPF